MGTRAQPNKFLLDIEDCVSELEQEFSNGKTPINDDCSILHAFQEKLELVLLFGLIEKPGLLGPKKSYWNYICTCFASSKRKHDGINFVKSVASLKTSVGRGRAFIRFCLTQKCLADTLQVCFMNQKVSRDFYAERSLPQQENLWSSLVSTLYELNDINFDLNSGYTELDISWPKFARKVFTPSETISLPRKNMSSSSLHSFVSQDEYNIIAVSDLNPSSELETSISNDSAKGIDDASMVMLQNEELSQQNKCLQNKIRQLEGEKSKLESDFQELLMKYQYLQQQLSSSINAESFEFNNNQIALKEKDKNLFLTCTDSVLDAIKPALVPRLVKEEGLNEITVLDDKHPNSSSSSPIKSDIKEDLVEGSDCALNNYEHSAQKSSPLNSGIDSFQFNAVLSPHNQIYMTEFLQEIKTVIDDIEDIIQKSNITLAMPYITRLKRIRNFLEEKVSSDIDKSKSHLNFSNFVENCVSSIKKFILNQESAINVLQENSDAYISKNQNLYSRIGVLKDLLKSYGFLKILSEKDNDPRSSVSPLDTVSFLPEPFEGFSYDNLAHDPLLKRIIVPLLPVINSSFVQLNTVNEKMKELDIGLDSAIELVNFLITRVQDQGMHLKGVTKELEEAQNLVSILKEQHTKLQSAEGILKYDLQEKRKLLSRLRQQLENTREDFNAVHLKNSKSEAEWKDLRKEFVQRHKQTSEESGFLDDRGFEDRESTPSNSSSASTYSEENIPEKVSPSESPGIPDQNSPPKKSRLELLEEQCQNLYSNLLQSSKRRLEIDRRLESVCKSVDRTVNRTRHKRVPSDSPAENCENTNEFSPHSASAGIFPIENCAGSLQFSSDIGSLNSGSSSYVPEACTDNSLSDNLFCDSSKIESCTSSSLLDSETVVIQTLINTGKMNTGDSLPDVNCSSGCISECRQTDDSTVASYDTIELTESDDQSSLLSHVDSLLIKKKDLEESLRNLAAESDLISSSKAKYLETEEYLKQISSLEEEKIDLLNQIRELEGKVLMTSTELDHTKQQLMLSKVTKEHEVGALQFQLNTEVLKYEQALKEFSEQSKGLESMKQKVTDQEQLILALEEALTEIRLDRESEKEQQWQELEDIHFALEAREQECVTLCQDLEKSLCDIEEERKRNEILLSQLEDFKVYSERDKESMKSELAFLQSYSQELQKKLIKLLKEKDILWKRSNHLYHLQKDKMDDRWMEDSEVSCCLGCKNNFSFMLRKHHCRLCGRIFCYLCSNNWLLTASSSKKIRSCNDCFMQYMETKKSVRRGSDVPQVEEDSGDEGFSTPMPCISKSNCSFTSEIPSSINDSIISLPITQKQSTPRFSSAPDLRYVSKVEEGFLYSRSFVAEKPLEETEERSSVTNDEIKQTEQVNEEISQDLCTSVMSQHTSRICTLREITLGEIKETEQNLNGEFLVCSGRKVELLIFCETCPIILQWCFTTNNQDVSFTIMCKRNKHADDEASLFNEQTPKLQDEMLLVHPGHYGFCFDNTSRNTEMKIQYSFSFKDAVG